MPLICRAQVPRTRQIAQTRMCTTMSAVRIPEQRRSLLDRSWTEASELYLRELVPRFLPWMGTGLAALLQHDSHVPPHAPVLVPCCGPGHELPAAALALGPGHEVIGVDLSQGMISLAQQVVDLHASTTSNNLGHASPGQAGQASFHASSTQPVAPTGDVTDAVKQASEQALAETKGVLIAASRQLPPTSVLGPMQAYVGDACADMEDRFRGTAGAVLSVFGLQQLGPLAASALAGWVRCLAPGGVAVVVMWPSAVEQFGPWAAFDHAVSLHHKALGKSQAPPVDWETPLLEQALKVEGAELCSDTMVQHPMTWHSVDEFWRVMVEGGPWRARLITFGPAYMQALKARFMDVLVAQSNHCHQHQHSTQQQQQQPQAALGAAPSSNSSLASVSPCVSSTPPSLLFPALPSPTAAAAAADATAEVVEGAGKDMGGLPLVHHPWARMVVFKRSPKAVGTAGVGRGSARL